MSSTKVVVDYDLCEANGVCVGVAPEVFDLDEADQLQVLQERPADDLLRRVADAVASCPKQALSLQPQE